MTFKIVHVNVNNVQRNTKKKIGERLPVCRVQLPNSTVYGWTVDIDGPSKMVYSPDKPLKCGAKLWIVTNSPVIIDSGLPTEMRYD